MVSLLSDNLLVNDFVSIIKPPFCFLQNFIIAPQKIFFKRNFFFLTFL